MAKIIGTDSKDNITGTKEADKIDAGKGDDIIAGGAGDDEIQAGSGNDVVSGGAGNDTLIGDAPLVSIVEDHTVTVTFDSEGAGYKNTVGVYKVDPDTGAIGSVDLVWANASAQGSGGDLVGGKSTYSFDVEAGEQIGFFLVANGYSTNNFDKMADGEFKFVNADGTAASISGGVPKLVFEDANGNATSINGNIYHSAGHGENVSLNADGIAHTKGYSQGENGEIQIGFEDLYNGGDKDFDDIVFTVDIGEANVKVLNQHYDSKGNPIETPVFEGSADKLMGGAGADKIDGMQGNDLLAGGGAGAEWTLVDGKWEYDPDAISKGGEAVKLDQSDDVIVGGTGDDVLLGGGGNDKLDGGDGDDVINAGTGDDVAYGGTGNDTLNMEDGDDLAYGGDGNDVINAGAGDDVAYGGDGDDKLRGGDGDDRLYGGDGKDELHGGDGDDQLDGGAGDDKLFGGAGDDVLSGGDGNDHLSGGAGDDKLDGGAGKDMLKGGAGDDHLSGGDGDDKLIGGSGADTIEGGAGNDHMWGGNWSGDNASDTFVISAGGGKDMIHDFETDHDVIDLSSYGLEFSDIAALMTNKGWATEIDLSELTGGGAEDMLIIKSIDPDDLDESNFLL